MEREETIDLKDLAFRILLRWRLVIGMVLIFAILGNVYGIVSSYRSMKQAEAQMRQADAGEAVGSQSEENLTEAEIRQVKDAVEDYTTYEKVYRHSREYYNASVKMNLNPVQVAKREVIYRITETEDSKEILELIRRNLLSDEVCQSIMEQNRWNLDNPEYVRELISANILSVDNTMGAEFEYQNNSETSISSTNLVIDDDNSDLLSIKMIAETEEECLAMAEQMEAALPAVTDDVEKEYGAFRLEKVSETKSVSADQDLRQEQKTFVEGMNSINNLMEAADDALSEDQKTYYLELLNATLAEEQMSDTQDEADSSAPVNVVIPSVQYISVRNIILGAIIGLFLACFYVACRYVLGGRLNAAAFAPEESDILLGTIYTDQRKKGFGAGVDRLVIRLFKGREMAFARTERLQMAGAAVLAAIRKDAIRNLYISGTVETEETTQLVKELKEQIASEKVAVGNGVSILHSPKSLEQLTLSQGAVFVEQTGVSYTQDVYEEMRICRKNGIPVIGFIVIDTLE